MKADALSNPGLSEEMAASAESLKGARERELPARWMPGGETGPIAPPP